MINRQKVLDKNTVPDEQFGTQIAYNSWDNIN